MYLPDNTLLQGGKYRITRFIASGGFGCTYEAVHVMLGKRLAIKEFFVKDFCNRDETTSHVTVGTQSKAALVSKLKKKFIDEASALSQFNHPNIVHVSDVFEENGTAYYVMDFIDGKSIHEILKMQSTIPEGKAVKYIRQVSEALKELHAHNRLHLDIKPGNIIIDKGDNAFLIDFGASKQYDEADGENTSTLLGKTPGYAPPEQMGNNVSKFSAATDIYSLGATLYKMLTGVTPPNATDLASGEVLPTISASVSANVRNAVYKAMELQKPQRPQSVADFVAMLDNGKDVSEAEATVVDARPEPKVVKPEPPQPPVTPVVEPPIPQPPIATRRKMPAWGWAAVAFLCMAVIIAVVMSQRTAAPDNGTDTIADSLIRQLPEVPRTFDVNGVSFVMVPVEGGSFNMGATDEKGEYDNDEYPLHRVTLGSYMLGETEVTQELWQAVMGENPSRFKGDRRPVENVSWNDCQEFISRLNQLKGEHFRLPTEAEWEYAARGGNKAQTQTIYSGSDNILDVAWFRDNSNRETHDVKSKMPNQLGLYDMSGNVWEWCSDWYGGYSSSAQTNPTGPSTGSNRVDRGGCWRNPARYCRVSLRDSSSPGYRYYRGLRLAL